MARSARLAVFLLVALAGAGAAAAQGGSGEPAAGVDPRVRLGQPLGSALAGAALDRITEELTAIMRCVVCQGLSVADSPAPAAVAMKAEVRELLAAGYTRDQVLAYFEASYGEFIRLVPKAQGFNLFVWAAPLGALLVGALLVALRLGGGGRRRAAGEDEAELAAYRERVRREVGS